MFAAMGKAASDCSIAFVSQLSIKTVQLFHLFFFSAFYHYQSLLCPALGFPGRPLICLQEGLLTSFLQLKKKGWSAKLWISKESWGHQKVPRADQKWHETEQLNPQGTNTTYFIFLFFYFFNIDNKWAHSSGLVVCCVYVCMCVVLLYPIPTSPLLYLLPLPLLLLVFIFLYVLIHILPYHWCCGAKVDIDAETYEVVVDGKPITCAPARRLPLAQRFFLFWWAMKVLQEGKSPPHHQGSLDW